MIIDRTYSDVERAKEILKKLKSLEPISEEEYNILERGTVTYNTLNRIESKQREIAEKLLQWHYLKRPIENKIWTEKNIFSINDLERIVNNTINLRESFFVINDNIPNPQKTYFYIEFNSIEKILYEIYELILVTPQSFKYSGTFNSGQYYILPQ